MEGITSRDSVPTNEPSIRISLGFYLCGSRPPTQLQKTILTVSVPQSEGAPKASVQFLMPIHRIGYCEIAIFPMTATNDDRLFLFVKSFRMAIRTFSEKTTTAYRNNNELIRGANVGNPFQARI